MNRQGRPAILAHKLGQIVGSALRVRKNDHLAVLLTDLLEVLDESAALVKFGAHLNDLLHVAIGRQFHRANVDLHIVVQKVGGHALHFFGPRRREHERLAVRANLLDNLANLRLKAHIQHTVRLIHHQIRHTTQIRLADRQHVNQASWRRNHNLGTTLQCTDLRSLGHTTIHRGRAHTARRAKATALVLDLHGQFTRRRKNQCNGTVAILQRRLRLDMNKTR